jgi:hypothetical protein
LDNSLNNSSESNSNNSNNDNSSQESTDEELESIVDKIEKLISNEMSDEEVEDYLEELQSSSVVSPYADEGELAERFENNNKVSVNPKLEKDLIYIFESVNRQDKMNSAALNSYSGRFDPRSVIRNDYKYFLKSGQGNHKGNSKLHLNIVVDRSGSMSCNEKKVQSLLKTIDRVCRQVTNLDYTILSIGNTLRIEDSRTYIYKACGGNSFRIDMEEIMKSVQRKDAVTYNLVLFDGQACWGRDEAKRGAAFNGSNFCIISDPDNRRWISDYCPASRVVITEDYYNTFEKELVKSLGAIVK